LSAFGVAAFVGLFDLFMAISWFPKWNSQKGIWLPARPETSLLDFKANGKSRGQKTRSKMASVYLKEMYRQL